jgi:3-phenylpropionate/trans-cinnamate dioxygenase ferredoxin subunit
MARHVIGAVVDLPPGARKIVELEGQSIGVFNVSGSYYALRNRCPHQGGPLCLGSLKGTALPSRPGEYIWGREGEILRCPWHGWEFDVTTGRSLWQPERCRVRAYEVTVEPEEPAVQTYPVTIESGRIVVHV